MVACRPCAAGALPPSFKVRRSKREDAGFSEGGRQYVNVLCYICRFLHFVGQRFGTSKNQEMTPSMKKIHSFTILGILLSGSSLFAQNINISADSISTLLCKKWELDYALMGGMKIQRMPGATEMNLEFNKDKTFIKTGKDPKDKTKGAWSYDPKKKQIMMKVSGKSIEIISLKEDQFVMLADTKEATPDDPTEIRLVYKLKNE
jgi:hypothetical protein